MAIELGLQRQKKEQSGEVFDPGVVHRHLATNDIGEPVMATPALSRGLIYVRGKNSLFAIGQQTKR